MKTLFLFILLFYFHLKCFPQNNPIDPYKYIATLRFDGEDFFDSGERDFPLSFMFNTTQDANNDSLIDVEDNVENLVRFSIGDSIYGTGRTGLPNRGPNDQRPAVYFHFVQTPNYDVYEYWLYYADNDWLTDHEHDWERYYVYVQDTSPVYIRISNHSDFFTFSWCEIPKDDGHPYIGVDGGSHAMKMSNEDGVKIRYNGEISKNNGRLDFGDSLTIPWIIYSNDSNVLNSVTYIQYPDTFYYGDPVYFTNSDEWGDPRDAPWKRDVWDTLPPVPIVYLGSDTAICSGDSVIFDAGSGFSSYLWSDNSTGQAITVSNAGIYYVEVTDNFGCSSRDTIEVFVTSLPTADFGYAPGGLTVVFSDSSANAISYSWNYGDGNTDSVQNPTHTYVTSGTYNICLTVNNDCGTDSVCKALNVTTTGIRDINLQNKVKIYPNPVSNRLIINYKNVEQQITEIKIYNMMGKIIYKIPQYLISVKSGLNTVNMANLPLGVYYVKLNTTKEAFTKKIILIN
ncbi:T9SS type A sorting domain-containing protein [bacterium AH-315-M05]|nr:T9SS type A sorting domain-containing protein [bacterium AH-315-M05]